ncbi:MAG: hypothetical protein UW68_C0047G0002 [Candidatus Collierbacteria bacterium GW2011_GWB1_44_6]|uniref:Uncharacterized protein n=1 Tax=Candidatus Collierbacteria bacterium GW2011_GWB1_44_6 TaxID=1618384 RepID=A0A0G1JKP5_9BACT|nr:MAG: hypothetical protein UW68_C0047G0002 [Candidatus Collierbacteria bacterium GW2011_GWB1_44_6]KKT82731.1 MAG: hypothetical protein UW80_C0032G0002 [Microgenomates group bacterium GW2011_GWC1_44_9]
MKELFTTIFSEIGHKLAMLLLVGTTTITTGTAVYKLSTKPPKTVALENQATNSAEVESERRTTPSLTPTPITRPTTTPSPRTTPKPVISVGLKANISTGTQIDDNGDDEDKEEFEDEGEREQETREREDSENEDRYVNSTNIEIKNEQED